MSFENNIKKWVEYDTLIKKYNEKIKSLRDDKSEIEKEIHLHISSYDKKPIINISDGTLKFSKINVQQPLSYKLIENSMHNVIKNEKTIEIIMNAIRDNRISKENDVIKRYYR